MMKNKILIKMLDMLTGAYTRTDLQRAQQELKPVTNIGKLFSIFAYGVSIWSENISKKSGCGIISTMLRVRCWTDMVPILA